MGSGIGNRRLLQALGRVLGIEDTTQAPQFLRTDELVPTISLDPGMAGTLQVGLTGQVSATLAAEINWQAIGSPDNLFSAAFPPQAFFRSNADRESVVIGYYVAVSFAAAPAEGTWLRLTEFRQAANDAISMLEMSVIAGQYVDGVRSTYYFTFPTWQHLDTAGAAPARPEHVSMMGASPIYVPAGSKWGLRLQYWDNTFSNPVPFPEATLVTVNAFVVHCPAGMRPPGI